MNIENMADGREFEELEVLRRVRDEKKRERRREVVAIRLPAATVRKARALGKGYTGILARLIEMALDDPAMLEKAL